MEKALATPWIVIGACVLLAIVILFERDVNRLTASGTPVRDALKLNIRGMTDFLKAIGQALTDRRSIYALLFFGVLGLLGIYGIPKLDRAANRALESPDTWALMIFLVVLILAARAFEEKPLLLEAPFYLLLTAAAIYDVVRLVQKPESAITWFDRVGIVLELLIVFALLLRLAWVLVAKVIALFIVRVRNEVDAKRGKN